MEFNFCWINPFVVQRINTDICITVNYNIFLLAPSMLISTFWPFYCVYLDPEEGFLILIFANSGITSKFKQRILIKFLYLLMTPAQL